MVLPALAKVLVVFAQLCSSFKALLNSFSEEYSFPRRTSTIFRACNKLDVEAIRSVLGGLFGDLNFWGQISFRFVHAAGMKDRLPSGRTKVKCKIPLRCSQVSTSRDFPCNGWRFLIIVTFDGKPSRWVVCRVFLRCNRPRMDNQVC